MITAVVKFKLPPEMSRDKWQEHIKQVSARFSCYPIRIHGGSLPCLA
jgi:hypothetical protein